MKRLPQKILIILFLFLFSTSSAIATELLSESFSDCGNPAPADWEVMNSGGNCDWIFNSDRSNETGGEGCFAMADSDACGSGTSMDTVLVAPSIDCSVSTGTTLTFAYDAFLKYSSASLIVEISVNGGMDWMNIWQKTEPDRVSKTETIDISSEADGQPSVLIRFHYHADAWDWWWQLDDVVVSSSDNEFNWLLFLPAIVGRQNP